MTLPSHIVFWTLDQVLSLSLCLLMPKLTMKQNEAGANIITGTRYVKNGGVHAWNLMCKLTSKGANVLETWKALYIFCSLHNEKPHDVILHEVFKQFPSEFLASRTKGWLLVLVQLVIWQRVYLKFLLLLFLLFFY